VNLTFDEPTHAYEIDGEPVPSVTQVLNAVMPGWQAGEWYLQRGQAVHACAAMIARRQKFDHDSAITGQVTACYRFFRELNPTVIAVERRVASARYGYAGTLDLLCELQGRLCVLDYKASISEATPYQVAAYSLAYGETCDVTPPRWGCAVELLESGYYRMSKGTTGQGPFWDLRQYTGAWLAMLAEYRRAA
jgi:hypothetical protein